MAVFFAIAQCYVSQIHRLLSDHFASCQTSSAVRDALHEPIQNYKFSIVTRF